VLLAKYFDMGFEI